MNAEERYLFGEIPLYKDGKRGERKIGEMSEELKLAFLKELVITKKIERLEEERDQLRNRIISGVKKENEMAETTGARGRRLVVRREGEKILLVEQDNPAIKLLQAFRDYFDSGNAEQSGG